MIDRDTRMARAIFGKGVESRRIPLAAIREVFFKPGSLAINGWICLDVGTSTRESAPSGDASDPDTVIFTWGQRKEFQKLNEALQEVVTSNHQSGADFAEAPPGTPSRIDRWAQRQDEKSEAAITRIQESSAKKFERSGVRQDIAAAAGRLQWSLGGKREIGKLATHLMPDEKVEYLAQGTYEGDQGILALTDHRLLFLFAGIARSRTEDFPISAISSVQAKSGPLIGEVKIHASGNDATISDVAKGDAAEIAEAIRRKVSERGRALDTPPATQAAPDLLEQIRKLAELRDSGVLTAEEFEGKKADLLGKI